MCCLCRGNLKNSLDGVTMSIKKVNGQTPTNEILRQSNMSYIDLFKEKGKEAAIKGLIATLIYAALFSNLFTNITPTLGYSCLFVFLIIALWDSFKFKWLGKWLVKKRN